MISQIIMCQCHTCGALYAKKMIQFEDLPCANPTLRLPFKSHLRQLSPCYDCSHKGLFTAKLA